MRIFRRHVEPAWQDTVIRLKRRGDRADAEIERLRAGEDTTPAAEGVMLTPGQWTYRWNRSTGPERIARVELMYEAQATAFRCFVLDHAGAVELLRDAQPTAARLAGQVGRVTALATQWAAPGGAVSSSQELEQAVLGRLILAALEEPAAGGARA